MTKWMSGACWIPLARALEGEYDVVLPDARGHGNSSAPLHGYLYRDHASDVIGLIEALGLAAPLLRFDDDAVRHAACRFRPGSVFWRNDLLSAYGAIQCVDKRLHLDEFVTCALRVVPGTANTFACVSLSSIIRARALFSVSSRSLIEAPFASISNPATGHLSRTLPEARPSGRRS